MLNMISDEEVFRQRSELHEGWVRTTVDMYLDVVVIDDPFLMMKGKSTRTKLDFPCKSELELDVRRRLLNMSADIAIVLGRVIRLCKG